MSRKVVFTLAGVAMLSCRAVLGIEDLDDPTTDGGKPADSGTDAGPNPVKDGGTDTGVDGNACWSGGVDCGKCCRDLDKDANKNLQDILGPCVCDGGCPKNECGSSVVCGGQSEPAGTTCIPECLDKVVRDDKCPGAQTECFKNAACKAVYDCVHGCP